MIAESQRAGHVLRVKAPKLAEAAVAEQYRLQPDLADRYGERGRRYCVRDVGHHVEALAASIELGDPARFVAYARWARGVMAAHGIPEPDFLAGLRALRHAAAEGLAPPVARLACQHIDAALSPGPVNETVTP